MAAREPDRERHRRSGWAPLVAAAALVVAILLLIVYGCDNGSKKSGNDGATTAAIVGTTGASSDAPGGGAAGGPAKLVAGTQDLLLLAKPGRSLSDAADAGAVKAKSVVVQEVVDHSGFWVAASPTETTDRVFVEVEKRGLTKVKLQNGNHVSFTGTIEKNLEAETYGLRANQGAALFRKQGYHVKTQASKLTVLD